jgi:hypothetical protein
MSAPVMTESLLDRARAALEEGVRKDEEYRAARQLDAMRQAIEAAVDAAKRILGLLLDPESVRADVPDGYGGRSTAHFTYDGLQFRAWKDSEYRNRLAVERQCASPRCVHREQPILQEIDRLVQLVADGPFLHEFPCQYPIDEDGEPIIPKSEMPPKRPAPVDYRTVAETAIAAIEQAGERLAQACRAEMALEDGRALVKAEAVKRIMQRDGIAATPAEKIAESDEVFAAYRSAQADAVVETIRARAAFEASKRKADLAIDLALALAGFTDHQNATRADALEVVR